MIVYRLSKSNYSSDISGKGAELSGGRWNSKGIPIIYTSDSRALCTAEIAVHTPLGILPGNYDLISIEIPDDSILETDISSLPANWKFFPHPNSTQKTGDSFVKAGLYISLKVPSAVIQGDFNYLINPAHKEFARVKILNIEPYSFDERLFKK
jgi:RES domain-containing protein